MDVHAFPTIAEIAVSLAGFVGIIVVLGRDERGFTDVALVSILVNSMGVAFFAFLPDVLDKLTSSTTAWRLSSGIFTVYHLYFMLRHLHKQRGRREVSGPLIAMVVGSVLVMLSTAGVTIGALLPHAFVIYYVALLYSLGIAVFFFSVLLIGANREPPLP